MSENQPMLTELYKRCAKGNMGLGTLQARMTHSRVSAERRGIPHGPSSLQCIDRIALGLANGRRLYLTRIRDEYMSTCDAYLWVQWCGSWATRDATVLGPTSKFKGLLDCVGRQQEWRTPVEDGATGV